MNIKIECTFVFFVSHEKIVAARRSRLGNGMSTDRTKEVFGVDEQRSRAERLRVPEGK